MDRKKTHKLVYTPDFDFSLIAISTDEPDYRLIWHLNRSLGWQLVKQDNLVLHSPRHGLKKEFSLYACHDELTNVQYHLIANRSQNGYLLNELKNIDFVLKITGELTATSLDKITAQIKAMDVVRACFVINPATVKSRHNLLF